MSAALMVLPMVWAMEELPAAQDMAFYRRYTEALLRRYLKMSMEAGRAPSLLGRELFRGNVTNYRVHSFEDVVIFVHDVETCLAKLDNEQRYYIDRIALEEYTQDEAVGLLGMNRRTMLRRYRDALDSLSRVLLDKGLLERRPDPVRHE